MRAGIFAIAALMACASNGAALAQQTPSDWVKCDGYARPEGAGTTAARVVAVISTMGLFGLPENSRSSPAARGQAGVDACTTVLAHESLERFWARRVSLLQARALHYVEANYLDSALEDLRAASGVAQGQAAEAWYQRSLGVSAMLLEAAILTKRGQTAEAERLAVAAADARPYSSHIAMLSSIIFAVDPALPEEEVRLLNRMVSYDPSLRQLRARALDWGEDRNLAADEYERQIVYEQGAEARQDSLGPPLALYARAALSSYRAGRNERAAELVAELRAKLAQPIPAPQQGLQGFALNQAMNRTRFAAAQRQETQHLMPVIEAYEVLRAGNGANAFARITGGSFPIEPASFDLLTESAEAAFPGRAQAIHAQIEQMRGEARANRSSAIRMEQYAEGLPPLEQIGGGNRFRSQGWGENGFRDTAAPTDDGRIVEFSGGTTITTTEELALLRAAQLAQDNGSTGFVVRSRSDFQRYYVTTYAGAETSRRESGFETRIDIAYVDAANPPAEYAGAVVNAEEVITALTPIFNPPRNRRR
jgi:hypothetical protein